MLLNLNQHDARNFHRFVFLIIMQAHPTNLFYFWLSLLLLLIFLFIFNHHQQKSFNIIASDSLSLSPFFLFLLCIELVRQSLQHSFAIIFYTVYPWIFQLKSIEQIVDCVVICLSVGDFGERLNQYRVEHELTKYSWN